VYGGELAMGLFLVSLGTLGVFTGHHWGLSSYMLIQGMVFVSFGFNMVDVGGLLGGRLDVEIIKVYSPLSTHPEVYRTSTVPIIQLNALGKSEEYLTSVESAPPSLTPYDGISRPPSPTHSASDSDNSLPSMASTASEGMSIISLDDKRSSPTSSLSNIYVKSSFTHARKGFRCDGISCIKHKYSSLLSCTYNEYTNTLFSDIFPTAGSMKHESANMYELNVQRDQ
jgi:hypothetical protein